ncbi:MAG: MBL fold metallo-hydrolase [Armatimonadota bacterium]
MDRPTMYDAVAITPDIAVLPSYFPIPTLGIIPVNAFVLKAAEPMLVDTGLVPLSDEFMAQLSGVIDPPDLRWLWLTHCHQDHLGSLQRILDQAPQLRVVTTFLGIGIMSLFQPLPLDRVYLLNPGQSISLGDREITAVKPPSYDSPETVGFHDPKSNAFFCADCFGALMLEPADSAAAIGAAKLQEGSTKWATVDAPWLHVVDRAAFGRSLDRVREMKPELVLSSHLPVARGMTEQLLGHLAAAPDAAPFVGPDQPALEAMLAGMRA